MVKVKIDYNPYLMACKVEFNGKEPHINSLVEKYDKTPLQIWMNQIPHILYDEMNGYDFDLEFVGPDLEYEDIVDSFRKAKVSADDVRCSHIKTMEKRGDKMAGITALNEWMDNNRNERFDFDTFKIENQDVFDNSFSLVIIGDIKLGDFSFDNTNVSIEVIPNVKELDNTELKDTPIIIEAERMTVQELQTLLFTILEENSDVIAEQFFIFVRSKHKMEMYRRLLEDIDFSKTCIINSISDTTLRRYFEYYPVSDYIREYLSAIRKEVNSLKSELSKEKDEADKANSEVMSNIMMIEDHISTIKDSIVELDNINKTSITVDWESTKSVMMDMLTSWKIKKTKITSYEEAIKLAGQFEEEIKHQWTKFIETVSQNTSWYINSTTDNCIEIYDKAKEVHTPKDHINSEFESYISSFDGIALDLLKIKEEHYEKPKEGLFNAFHKVINATSDNKEEVLVTTYSCQQWRECAVSIVTPVIDRVIEERNKEIQEHSNKVSLEYSEKLIKLLDERIEDKNRFSVQLSSDIQELQKDVDWLNSFSERLESIERS
ncbi:MAG: hypothetical protein IJ619_06110 [Eubacterium sp.]|nr:hypothetical protein [Eubacterium sp.]